MIDPSPSGKSTSGENAVIPAPRPAARVSQRRGGAAERLGTPLLWFPELAVSVEEEVPPDYLDWKYSRGRSWGAFAI